MTSFWVSPQWGILIFVVALLTIVISNVRLLHRLEDYREPALTPRVSILIPARNEERNILTCLRSVLAQDYPDFQVLVLDDESTDRTAQLALDLSGRDPKLTVLKGKPLPAGWLGKHWACHQLADAASGELLLFSDADTRHDPQTLRNAVAALTNEDLDLLTALPRQEVKSWSEKLLVPIIPWSLLSFLPLFLARWLSSPLLSAGIGQFMLFRRTAYLAIGGHAAVREHAADDLALARRVKAGGLRWQLFDASGRVVCRMYHNFRETFEGFSKNLFAAFDYHSVYYLLIWAWLGFVFLEPVTLVILWGAGVLIPPDALTPAVAAILVSFTAWSIVYWRFRLPKYLALFYPLMIILTLTVAVRSFVLTKTGKTLWKGRLVAP